MIDLKTLRESAENKIKATNAVGGSRSEFIAWAEASENYRTLANPQTIIELLDMIDKLKSCYSCKQEKCDGCGYLDGLIGWELKE